MTFEAFRRNRDERGDEPAFLISAGDRSVPITWRQFAKDVELIAFVVARYAHGAVIGLLGENSYEWVVAHVACVFSGATVVPLDPALTAEEIAERLTFTGAKALIHSALLKEKTHAVRKLMPGLMTGGFGTVATDLFLAKEKLAFKLSGKPGVFDRPPRGADETAMIVFTSGTTNRPRGAELTIAGLDVTATCWRTRLALSETDRTLMLLPLHHIFGLCAVYAALAAGTPLGVCPDFRRIYDAVERFRANGLFLVPALADLLAAKIAQRGATAEAALGAPIEWAVIGGAPLQAPTRERLRELGIRPLTAYGLTETSALGAIAPREAARDGSAGRVAGGAGEDGFGMSVKIRDDGHILVRGPAVMKGYFKEPERTAAVLSADGWFDTGDLGRVDAEGWLYVTGRAARTIILSSGKKVAPEELEEQIVALPGIREAVVSGDGATRRICAEIYADADAATVRRQIDILNLSLPVHKRIGALTLRTEPFPRTASGKISFRGNGKSCGGTDRTMCGTGRIRFN